MDVRNDPQQNVNLGSDFVPFFKKVTVLVLLKILFSEIKKFKYFADTYRNYAKDSRTIFFYFSLFGNFQSDVLAILTTFQKEL